MRPSQDHLIISDGYDVVPKLRQSGYIIGQPLSSPSANPIRTPIELPTHQRVSHEEIIVHQVPIPQGRGASPSKSLRNSHLSDFNSSSVVPQPHMANFIYNASKTPEKHITSPPRLVFYAHSLPSIQMVPYSEYKYYIEECRNWEEKYNALYNNYQLKYRTDEFNENIGYSSSEEHKFLESQNRRLRERIREMQTNKEKIGGKMENMLRGLIQKSKQATMKEQMLLADRFRLQDKAEGRFL